MGYSTWCSCFKCHFYNNPQILQNLGLDKNLVIKGENLFATLPVRADKDSKVNFGLQIDTIHHNV